MVIRGISEKTWKMGWLFEGIVLTPTRSADGNQVLKKGKRKKKKKKT